MVIKILAFGIAKEILGSNLVELDVADNATIGDLKLHLSQRFPALGQLSSFMLSINSEYASLSDTIYWGDEVAIIPPVSGG